MCRRLPTALSGLICDFLHLATCFLNFHFIIGLFTQQFLQQINVETIHLVSATGAVPGFELTTS